VIRTLNTCAKAGASCLVEGVVGRPSADQADHLHQRRRRLPDPRAKARGYKAAVETMMQEAVRKFGKARVNVSVVHGAGPGGRLDAAGTQAHAERRQELHPAVSPVLAIHTGPGLWGVVANLSIEPPGNCPAV
jgi:hypothetical protein